MCIHLGGMDPIVGTFPFLKRGRVNFSDLPHRRGSERYLNQSTIERWPLIHGQINWIKFVESKKIDNVYSKIWIISVWSIFLKIWSALIHQISWMKNIKSNLKSPQRRKMRTTNESTRNIFVARFSFGVLASLIFVIYFPKLTFTSTTNSLKHSWVILIFILLLLFQMTFRKENIQLTPNWFRSICSQIGVF